MATDFTFKNVPESIINTQYELNEWPQKYQTKGETGFSYTPLLWEHSFIVTAMLRIGVKLYYSPSTETFKEFIDLIEELGKQHPNKTEYEVETIRLLNDVYNAGGLIDWIEE